MATLHFAPALNCDLYALPHIEASSKAISEKQTINNTPLKVPNGRHAQSILIHATQPSICKTQLLLFSLFLLKT